MYKALKHRMLSYFIRLKSVFDFSIVYILLDYLKQDSNHKIKILQFNHCSFNLVYILIIYDLPNLKNTLNAENVIPDLIFIKNNNNN